jgi:hypothetical protein
MGQPALLVIADIGGYTKFMRVHRINLAHAQYIVAQLLEAVIDGAEPRLTLAKLEGDAAFFYALLPASKKSPVEALSDVVTSIRRRFLARQVELATDRTCTCDGCTQVGRLKLKFVAHVGEVAFQKVKRYTELAGVDVIFVHRLLKNTVPLSEYLLMSEAVYSHVDDDMRSQGREASEDLEGLGSVTTYYVDLENVVVRPTPPAPSLLRKVVAWIAMTIRSIPYFLGIRRSCDGFRNMGEVDPNLALPGASMPPPPGDTLLPPPTRPGS